jgi:hypothetical protein
MHIRRALRHAAFFQVAGKTGAKKDLVELRISTKKNPAELLPGGA